jgi:putative tryptophan/tyrosine transport system substrate-binding protein
MIQHVLRLALSALLVALSVPAAAQHIPRIGYLSTRPADMEQLLLPVFLHGLRELGYTEGHNIIERRYAPGGVAGAAAQQDRVRDLLAELVRLPVDVIVASAGADVAAQEATATIPIVFIANADPVGLGVVESLARPGGNVTGLTDFHGPLAGKRLELLKEIVPAASRIAFLWMAGRSTAPLQWQELQAAAPGVGVTLLSVEIAGPDDVDRAFTALAQARPEALVVHPTVTYTTSRILEFAVQHRLPAIYTLPRWVEAGGLMSYGAHFPDLWRRAATYVHKILQGTKPADLPVEQPMKFELVINLHTAEQMGLSIPPAVLFQADRVIK